MMFFNNEGFNSGSGSGSAVNNTVTMQAKDFYTYLEPQIIKTVGDALAKRPSGIAPNTLPNPMPAAFGQASQQMPSPAMRQGDDYSGCKPFNKDEYIRKDSIPCWGCSIPAPY
jgi:hypothetical protein